LKQQNEAKKNKQNIAKKAKRNSNEQKITTTVNSVVLVGAVLNNCLVVEKVDK
jgi:hypothetical protein